MSRVLARSQAYIILFMNTREIYVALRLVLLSALIYIRYQILLSGIANFWYALSSSYRFSFHAQPTQSQLLVYTLFIFSYIRLCAFILEYYSHPYFILDLFSFCFALLVHSAPSVERIPGRGSGSINLNPSSPCPDHSYRFYLSSYGLQDLGQPFLLFLLYIAVMCPDYK